LEPLIINVEEDSDINYEMDMEGTEPPLMNKRYIFIKACLFELRLSMFHYELNVFRTGSTQHHVGIGILLHLSNNM
jgi:hypothetical protein